MASPVRSPYSHSLLSRLFDDTRGKPCESKVDSGAKCESSTSGCFRAESGLTLLGRRRAGDGTAARPLQTARWHRVVCRDRLAALVCRHPASQNPTKACGPSLPGLRYPPSYRPHTDYGHFSAPYLTLMQEHALHWTLSLFRSVSQMKNFSTLPFRSSNYARARLFIVSHSSLPCRVWWCSLWRRRSTAPAPWHVPTSLEPPSPLGLPKSLSYWLLQRASD